MISIKMKCKKQVLFTTCISSNGFITTNWNSEDYLNNAQIEALTSKKDIKYFEYIIKNTFDLEIVILHKYSLIHHYNRENDLNRMILIYNESNNHVGTENIYIDTEYAVIDYILVLKNSRGKGYAKAIMFYLIS